MQKSEICVFDVLVADVGLKKVKLTQRSVDARDVMGIKFTSRGPSGVDLGGEFLSLVLNSGEELVTNTPMEFLMIRLFKIEGLTKGMWPKKIIEWLGENEFTELTMNLTRLHSGIPIDNPPVMAAPIEPVEEEAEVKPEPEMPETNVIKRSGTMLVRDNKVLKIIGEPTTIMLDDSVDGNRWMDTDDPNVKVDRDGSKKVYIGSARFRGIKIMFPNGGQRIYWNYLQCRKGTAYRLRLPWRQDIKVAYTGLGSSIYQYHYDMEGREYCLKMDSSGSNIVTKKYKFDTNITRHLGKLVHSLDLDCEIIVIDEE